MASPSPNQVLISVLVCLLLSAYQLQQANDAWTATKVRIGELYPNIYVQCETDIQEFCKSPSVPAQPEDSPTFLVSDPVSQDSTLTEIAGEHAEEIQPQEPSVPQTRQLRTASLGNRRLTEESHSSSPLFPFQCLEKAWTEQNVSMGCSVALHQLQSVEELKQQQEWNVKAALCVFWGTWVVFVLSSGVVREYLGGFLGFLINNRRVGWGFLVKYHWGVGMVLYVVFMCTGSSAVFILWWAWMMGWAFGVFDESKQDDAQTCSPSTQQTDACVCCCCKTPSDDPSPLAESCCECCNGTGRCSVDCASCCIEGCCGETCALSDSTTEQELLVPASEVEEKAL